MTMQIETDFEQLERRIKQVHTDVVQAISNSIVPFIENNVLQNPESWMRFLVYSRRNLLFAKTYPLKSWIKMLLIHPCRFIHYRKALREAEAEVQRLMANYQPLQGDIND